MRIATLFAVALGLLAVSAAQGQVATPIGSVPFTIKKPGNYVLKKDLHLTKAVAAAITIDADDVVLDLGGRVLSRDPKAGNTVVGIQTTAHGNIVVKNGMVRGFDQGVSLGSYEAAATGVTVEGLRVDKAKLVGIGAYGPQVIVRSCTVANTGGSQVGATIGIEVAAGTAVVAENNVLDTVGVNAVGIHMGAQSAVIERNRILNRPSATGGNGLILGPSTSSQNNTYYFVESNRVAGFATGIRFSDAVGEYRNNFTLGCTTPYVGGTDSGNNQ